MRSRSLATERVMEIKKLLRYFIQEKLEDLEEKLKQNQFKDYLAQTSSSQYDNRVERPYSVNRDQNPYIDSGLYHNSPNTQRILASPRIPQTKPPKPALNTLQVMYQSPNIPRTAEKKGHFNITKKRKLYSEKDFLNM